MSIGQENYPRDLKGYGATPPNPKWPNGARIALQVVLNYEEGGENCVLHGDSGAERFLSEIINAPDIQNERHMSMESLFEYGSRAGVWRMLRLFKELEIPATIFAVGSALERHPDMAKAFIELGHEVAGHGYKWIDYQNVPEDIEREHISKTIDIINEQTGALPAGWYTGRTGPNTNRLAAEHDNFLYNSDDYSDDLPFWSTREGKPQLIIPYSLDTNDMRFASPQGFNSGDQFFCYLKDCFDTLYEEGASSPKMMNLGLHCRIAGRPARTASVKRFLEYVKSKPGVWICRRIDIANHWRASHPYNGEAI